MRDFHLPGRSPVLATEGMCATSHPLAAKLALDTLARGGNAVDAAIAGAVLLGVCEPQMTGIGGDAFVLLKPAGSEEVLALNGSGRAPAAAKAQSLRAKGLKSVPPGAVEAVTIPGAIDAFCRLSAEHGKLGLQDTLGPVIPYFEAGVPVAPRVALDWRIAADRITVFLEDSRLSRIEGEGSPIRFSQENDAGDCGDRHRSLLAPEAAGARLGHIDEVRFLRRGR